MKRFFLLFFIGYSTVGAGQVLSQPMDHPIELYAEPDYFSPNGDALQDQTFFKPVLRTNLEPLRWVLTIRPEGKGRQQRLSGAGLPALIKWDGTDRKSAVMGDGEYLAAITVWTRGMKIKSEEIYVTVDTLPPLVRLAVTPPALDGAVPETAELMFTPLADEDALDRWQLQVLDVTGRSIHVWWSTGPLTPIHWDGSDPATGVTVPRGEYRAAFVAWDLAGNESAPAFVSFDVQTTAREMLQRVLKRITVNETEAGLLVQLNQSEMFDMVKGKPVVKESAKADLKEVAILINAYPDVPVRLDGYSRRLKTFDLDRDLSSLYAWSVYSHLVKEGHVKASRLQVRGRGRSAMFDRRSLGVPVLRGGVEVTLEGGGGW